MKIYVGHSSSIDFRQEIYGPLKESDLAGEHALQFPHEDGGIFDSKTYLREECDLFIAEVSEPSTGLGIELGWADIYDLPVVLLHREEAEVSGSLEQLSADVVVYSDPGEMVELLSEHVEGRE